MMDCFIDASDPWDEDLLREPYQRYAQLRSAGAVSFNEKYGYWALHRFEEVNSALQDWEVFCSSRGVGITDTAKEGAWRKPSLLLNADPPGHTDVRGHMGRIFSPMAIRKLREGFTNAAEQLVDGLSGREEVDAAAEIAEAFPTQVFPDTVGVRQDGRENLLAYGLMAFNSEGPKNHIYDEAFKNAESVHAWINSACQRENLTELGFGADIWALHDRGEVDAEQAAMLVRSVLTAGLDTTIATIGNTLIALARNPTQWEALKADPSLARAAVEEAIRYDSPVQLFFRTTTQDVSIDGTTIPEGSKVLLSLASANRDTSHWGEDAATYRIDRDTSGHVGFGVGIHRCLGQMMARLESEVVIAALARRYRSISLLADPEQRLNNVVRSRKSIPLSLNL